MKVCFISTKDQPADLLTKGLTGAKFLLLRSKLNIVQGQLSLQGAIKSIPTHTKVSV